MQLSAMRMQRTRSLVRVLFAGATLAAALFVQAAELAETEIGLAVQTWVRDVTADARPDAVVAEMEPYLIDGRTLAYIAHLEGGGYCLTGTDKRVLPVYFYSPHDTYDADNPSNRVILNEIANRTRRLTAPVQTGVPNLKDGQKALDERALFWERLIDGTIASGYRNAAEAAAVSAPQQMSLDLTSTWNQNSPYNDQCPTFPPGGVDRTFTGCVATATAQIMRYWEWPDTGVGSGSVDYQYWFRVNWDEEPLAADPVIPARFNGRLAWTAANGGRLRMNGQWDISILTAAVNISSDAAYRNALTQLWSRLTAAPTTHNANFGATTYNWGVLRNSHSDPVDAGDMEVARLSYQVGVAVEMDWGIWESGASEAQVPVALADHFRYDPDGVYEIKGASTADKLTSEIQWLRPLLYRGCTSGGGCHAWVVYGYNKATDPNRQFLMNLGWGSNGDGWYTLDMIDTNGDNNAEFEINQYHATRLAPQQIVAFVGNTVSGDGSPDNPYRDIREAVETVPDDATLIFKAGSINPVTGGSVVVDRPMTLKGKHALLE